MKLFQVFCLSAVLAVSCAFVINVLEVGQVHELQKDEELASRLKTAGNKLVVVDFYADWCGPCKQIAPVFKALAAEMPDVEFMKADVDQLRKLADEYRVSAIPTFIYFKNNKKIDELVGSDAKRLRQLVLKHRSA